MDAEKLGKLEEKLYNETPLLGERIRQQAVKELSKDKTPKTIEILTRALIFTPDNKLKNAILNTIKEIRIQDKSLINAVCAMWAQNRNEELTKLLKLRGWVAYNPLKLRVLTAVNLSWQGIFEEKGKEILPILLDLLDDKDQEIKGRALEWLANLPNEELEAEVCRLASEENNGRALEIAISANYRPSDPYQSTLFYYLTQQWERYGQVDPDQILLEQVYYQAPSELQQRMDDHGRLLKRMEWVWMRLGGKEGRRVKEIDFAQWGDLIEVLSNGRNWATLWDLVFIAPVFWSREIVKKLKNNRALPEKPEDKAILAELLHLAVSIKGKSIPQGKFLRCVHTMEGEGESIGALLLTPDSQYIISARGNSIIINHAQTGEEITTLKRHLKGVGSLAISEDGTILASGSRDKTVCMWRIPEGNILANLSGKSSSVWSLAMTKDCKIVASASYREIRLWHYPSGKLNKVLSGFETEVEKVIVSPDDNFLIAGGGKQDHTVKVWSLPDGELKYSLEGHQDAITALVVCPFSRVLVSASRDNTVKIWSLTTGENLSTLTDHSATVWNLAITPDGQTLVTVSEDSTAKLWQLANYTLRKTLNGHEGAIWCLNINSQGNLLATGSRDNTVRLWGLPDGEEMGIIQGHSQPIREVKISGDNRFLVTAGLDGFVKVWQWHLQNICNTPILALTPDDLNWLRGALDEGNLSPDEENWLKMIAKIHSLNTTD
ncbi:MAG: WD40 repeat domain-containing protein [Cyanobacterium sp. T60_A2020_053]|nr:WD40 repeat domain-containing protein [Cyanobacterium sp. T60_A2020_053]